MIKIFQKVYDVLLNSIRCLMHYQLIMFRMSKYLIYILITFKGPSSRHSQLLLKKTIYA